MFTLYGTIDSIREMESLKTQNGILLKIDFFVKPLNEQKIIAFSTFGDNRVDRVRNLKPGDMVRVDFDIRTSFAKESDRFFSSNVASYIVYYRNEEILNQAMDKTSSQETNPTSQEPTGQTTKANPTSQADISNPNPQNSLPSNPPKRSAIPQGTSNSQTKNLGLQQDNLQNDEVEDDLPF